MINGLACLKSSSRNSLADLVVLYQELIMELGGSTAEEASLKEKVEE